MNKRLGFIGDEAGYSIQKQIEFCNNNKIDFIHLRTVNGKLLQQISELERKIICNELDKNGIKVNCILSKLGKYPVKKENEWVKDAKEYVNLCKMFKSKFLRIFSYGLENETAVKEIVHFAKENNVVIVVENEINTPMNSVEQTIQVLERYNYSLFVLMDAGNLFLEKCDFVDFYYNLKHYIKLIHVKEFYLNNKGQYVGGELGKGCMNTLSIMKILSEDFSGEIVLEAHHMISDNNPQLKIERLQEIYTSFLK